MNLYVRDLSLYDFANFSDPIFDPISIPHYHRLHRSYSSSSSSKASIAYGNDRDSDDNTGNDKAVMTWPKSPPRHRHDGMSPLPLGMDWSLPPKKWDGRDTIWPHDSHTGWSYCVTIPSWILLPKSGGSDSAVFYRVQVGIQSPEGVTTTRGISRRFSDFLKLRSELKKEFPQKALPPAPPKRILRMKSRSLLEERRCSLEDWMEKILSDIDVSRSALVGTFFELEAAARSWFDDVDPQNSEANSSASGMQIMIQNNADVSMLAGSTSIASDHDNDSPDEISELGTPRHERYCRIDLAVEASTSEQNVNDSTEISAKHGDDSLELLKGSETFERTDATVSLNIQFPGDLTVALPSDKHHKLNRVLDTMRQRLATARTDMEDLIARLNQEVAVRQFLTTKVKDLEVDLETTRSNCKENVQQARLTEQERFTQMQWDAEELRRQCLEMELKLKSVQDEKTCAESMKISIIQENEKLMQKLDVARQELENLHKDHEELELKSKADVKLLVKEVKSLRSSQSDLKLELSRLMKEKLETERVLQKEKDRSETVITANEKLLHECEILRNRLQECSVKFLIEEEDKLIVDSSSPSDAIDLLTTSDNRIGLLLAEAQLLAQDVDNSVARLDESTGDDRFGYLLRKMLTEIFIDNATLRMQVNSVIRCALNAKMKSDEDNSDNDNNDDDETQRKTVLSKFLEK